MQIKKKKKNPSLIKCDWQTLQRGDIIKVTGGGYWPRSDEDGGNISIGYNGMYRVKYVDEDGIHAYPTDKNSEAGHCYIFMGEEKKSKSGAVLKSHRVKKFIPREKKHE